MTNIRTMLAALAILVTAGSAVAQTSNPILENYRAYEAALAAGNLLAAERAAIAALAASEARDGDGGRTAVLALNLANVRLQRGLPHDALAPAQRASGLVREGGLVEPLDAALTLGRAELGTGRPGAATRLRNAINQADARGDMGDEAYAAAMELGAAELNASRPAEARRLFLLAAEFARGGGEAQRVARADALVSQGMAMMTIETTPAYSIARVFDDAIELTRDVARRSTPNEELSHTQIVYARAAAWEQLHRSRLSAMDMPEGPQVDRALLVDANSSDGTPVCALTVRRLPAPTYSEGLRERMINGSAAMVLFRTNSAGETVEARTIALAGAEEMAREINVVAPRWNASYSGAAGCSRAALYLFPVRFYVDGN
ncbi:MAG: hypothetical protein M0D54_09605 [Hyphomonadaceae bacterium JAD_PAG50586_4]|nr:MAG: hypothetical protein M0D54_09605 [Hyphomonadaceae bacterium JAD_PAG50586_4]